MKASHSGGNTLIYGADATGDSVYLYSNETDTFPILGLIGSGGISFYADSYENFLFKSGSTDNFIMHQESGKINFQIKECTSSPDNKSDFGQLYTKSDNHLYFKDGDGTEYTIDKT